METMASTLAALVVMACAWQTLAAPTQSSSPSLALEGWLELFACGEQFRDDDNASARINCMRGILDLLRYAVDVMADNEDVKPAQPSKLATTIISSLLGATGIDTTAAPSRGDAVTDRAPTGGDNGNDGGNDGGNDNRGDDNDGGIISVASGIVRGVGDEVRRRVSQDVSNIVSRIF